VAAKAKQDKHTLASRDAVAAEDAKLKKAQGEERRARANVEDLKQKAEAARLRFRLSERQKANRQAREDAEKATVPVIVQTRRDMPVRVWLRGKDGTKRQHAFLAARTPIMVPRAVLRQLEGQRNRGKCQLIVGELEKPGEMLDRGDDKAKPIKLDKATKE